MNIIDLQKIIEEQKRKEIFRGNILANIHYTLMLKFGWIPYEEFKKLPVPMVLNLLMLMRKEAEEMEKNMRKKYARV